MEFPIIIRAIQEPRLEMFDRYLGHKVNKGESEYDLFEYLRNKKLPVFANQFINPYFPDILILNKKQKFLIDIELDEPYSKLGKPTHYIGNDLDNKRNRFLNDKGVHIIRFSEKQVISNVNLCYLIIDLFIKSLKDLQNESTLLYWCNKISEPQWTRKQSELLCQNRAREIYPFDIIFEEEPIHKIKIDKPMEYLIDPVLKVLSTDDIIEIPTLINRIKNNLTKEIGFSYYGLHFSNSEYNGNCQELTKVRIVQKDSYDFPFFEKYFHERILFRDKNYECIPFMIIKSGPNHDSCDIKLLK
jgi:very-short-patch-repair endonuclease